MPTYEYLCDTCGEVMEEMHSIKDIPQTAKCKCGCEAHKIMSASNWILKGPGDNWPSQQNKRKGEMTRNNEAAGKRGYGMWKERSPKLVYR